MRRDVGGTGERTSDPSTAMTDHLIGEDDLLATFSQQRQLLLKHTADLICPGAPHARQALGERESKLSAILVSSLEELKVAEEELAERVEALASVRDEFEERLIASRQLFDLMPACLLVTDSYGSILDANRAFQALIKRDLGGLERQPFARFIPSEERRAFRDGLARLVAGDGVSDWRLLLARPSDARVAVSAAVHVLRRVGSIPQVQLFWAINVLGSAASPLDA
jgi:PAS domain-containing protein